ncbi:hypothetical protein [Sphingomonas prati]|uniref:Uncharacterized protein n=1 Tax=Sphingomonas prati TaxID=1843237 RepID=A0A7W9F4J4_9SPHN|nr:hypothetical protein [Sphingomonas prati]MBB5730984.1 hypothetical protein [Sphingomonas prati]GGE98190.1 hypothetical protein GCM10011404_34190 [Sphingomonas prati]
MVPFTWRSDEIARPAFSVGVIAQDIGARRILRPSSSAELAAVADLSISQFVDGLAGALLSTGSFLFQQIEGDPFADGAGGLVVRIERSTLASLVLDQSGELQPPVLPLAYITALEASLNVVEIILSEGSLIIKALGAVFGTGAGLTAALFLLGPEYTDWHATRLADHDIVRVIAGGRCSVDFAAELHIGDLRAAAAEGLVKNPQASQTMKRRRVCIEQVLLNGTYPGKFDDMEGPMTAKAKQVLAKKSGLTTRDVDTLPYFEALIAGIQPKH